MIHPEKKHYTIPRTIINDSRGWFLKTIDGNEPGNPFPCEVYFTSAKPGESKGGHYHELASEWFTLIQGDAELILTDILSGETTVIALHEKNPSTIFVPPGMAHLFRNCGDKDFLLVAFTDQKYHAVDTIKFEF